MNWAGAQHCLLDWMCAKRRSTCISGGSTSLLSAWIRLESLVPTMPCEDSDQCTNAQANLRLRLAHKFCRKSCAPAQFTLQSNVGSIVGLCKSHLCFFNNAFPACSQFNICVHVVVLFQYRFPRMFPIQYLRTCSCAFSILLSSHVPNSRFAYM